ncbi:putative ATP-grasp-modified RiPP [Streptomyces sparsogenes]|uniref:ATP-grasp-modified RiPP n=1 Tax=Streptomyces sparsogenes DSM 40356 TaxID=1331668 RepID=A0A1R1S5Q0_9ACTN|nr:putative ATP-grasp-modified RiPP [Streptomyces sparsogenes]OMI33596.1 hypothetical protein SPAR_40697 [Streptomyces sparsogenes DSM 40356]
MNLIEALPLGRPAPVGTAPVGMRPYALQGARFRVSDLTAPSVETRVYDPVAQTASMADGTPLVSMATSQKTNPDGDIKNPPPSDEGSDPGYIE